MVYLGRITGNVRSFHTATLSIDRNASSTFHRVQWYKLKGSAPFRTRDLSRISQALFLSSSAEAGYCYGSRWSIVHLNTKTLSE